MKKFDSRLSYSDLYLKLHARAEWTAKVEDDVFQVVSKPCWQAPFLR